MDFCNRYEGCRVVRRRFGRWFVWEDIPQVKLQFHLIRFHFASSGVQVYTTQYIRILVLVLDFTGTHPTETEEGSAGHHTIASDAAIPSTSVAINASCRVGRKQPNRRETYGTHDSPLRSCVTFSCEELGRALSSEIPDLPSVLRDQATHMR